MDAMELDTARHAIRPDKEYETVQRLQAAYGKKLDSKTLVQSRKDITETLGEPAEPASIHQKLQQLQERQNEWHYTEERHQER